jgi:hypothetical protein
MAADALASIESASNCVSRIAAGLAARDGSKLAVKYNSEQTQLPRPGNICARQRAAVAVSQSPAQSNHEGR